MDEHRNNDDDNYSEPIKYDDSKEIVEDKEKSEEHVEHIVEHIEQDEKQDNNKPEITPKCDTKESKKN